MNEGFQRYEIRVRYGDTDKMGFAYHAHYLRWFEIGRVEFLRAHGLRYRDVEAAGVSLPVLEARVRYLKPGRYDDALAIDTGVIACGRAKVTFGYRLWRTEDDRALLAHGTTEHCFMDRDGRPVRPPAELAAILRDATPVTLELG